ncbi:response regulator transcription factor [Ructibacterium gallinarum]|uniref:Stage 0 sporulation protein A homolog n=1 Tax=Ructibacterium gallinarum TaxID=2779355 RepID=A0A9D5M2G3_9FIRM|nr:response regulator [Ructibacterium gallinarum]MBE5040911.1 response regulator [Ructibacterium gallinarum]
MDKIYKAILIDDEIFALDLLKKIKLWDQYGIEITACFKSAEEAMTVIDKMKPDIIFCDIQMEKMSGIDFAKYCYENYPHTTFVLMSAYTDFHYAQQAIKYGVTDYITKPITRTKLEECIKGIISKHDNKSTQTLESYDRNFIDYTKKHFFLQKLISDIRNGMIMSLNDVDKIIESSELSSDLLKSFSMSFKIHINNYSAYMEHIWKYGNSRLYSAISNIMTKISTDIYIIIVSMQQETIECVLISNSVKMDTYLDEIKNLCFSILKLEIEYIEKNKVMQFEEIIKSYFPVTADERRKQLINKTLAMIDQEYANPDFDLDYVLKKTFVSKSYFCKIFKIETGITFTHMLNNIRLEHSIPYLLDCKNKISSIYEFVGFSSNRYYYKLFTEKYGITPAEYRNQHIMR